MIDRGRMIVLACFVAIVALPFFFRRDREATPSDATPLIIITPHNEQIREEFARAFEVWHEREHGAPVRVVYSTPGGTSEIRRMLVAQFTAAMEDGRAPGGEADLVFGGGSYEHDLLKRGVEVTVEEVVHRVSITEPTDITGVELAAIYGPNRIGDAQLYDEDRHWLGVALSGFGIVFNRDVLGELGLPEPTTWSDLANPALAGWVALVNPGQSGSITTAFDTILQQLGWDEGWAILRRAAANARYFSASSLKPPGDVGRGDASLGVCIDFYGRYQAQAIRDHGGGDRVGYIDPPGVTTIDADPISLLRAAPHPVLANRFIRFCLTEEAQALWQFPAGEGDLGPRRYELRRLPVLRSMYAAHLDRMIDGVDPFTLARPLAHPEPSVRAFIAPLFSAMAMDVHGDLRAAWAAITAHPSYPPGGGLVTAADVDDPGLRRMLTLFDEMPEVEGPGGTHLGLRNASDRAAVKAGWLRGGWSDHGLWHVDATPQDVFRRRCADFFRDRYAAITSMARAPVARAEGAP